MHVQRQRRQRLQLQRASAHVVLDVLGGLAQGAAVGGDVNGAGHGNGLVHYASQLERSSSIIKRLLRPRWLSWFFCSGGICANVTPSGG